MSDSPSAIAANIGVSKPQLWTRSGVFELLANVAVIAAVPLIARSLWPMFREGITNFGFAEIVEKLAGAGGWTDVGWEVASTIGLVKPDFSAYDSLEVLHPLVGMQLDFVDLSVNSHPPMAIPLGLPLAYLDYGWWLSFYVIASFCLIALSMRLMQVPAYIAYPLALGIGLTVPGRWGLMSTYPLSAVLIALAWKYRRHPVIAGAAYGIYGSSRGFGLLMLLYPLIKRQWKTLIIGAAIPVALLAIAVVLEPAVITNYLDTSRASIAASLQRNDLMTVGALLRRSGSQEYVAWLLAAAVAAVALWRKQEPFWVINWFILAVSPIAWLHTFVMAIPLLVVVWRSSKLGVVLVLVAAASIVSPPPLISTYFSINWVVVVVVAGIALLSCPMQR
ncbi:MAG: glycosyltransferase family 87 protein, partial [Actinomycetota bacterium]|nr:glycosyltransferase family 87 protein [Actinomycetota bacterium]